jgi:drug/metabolite transporter (DMT)-like permease
MGYLKIVTAILIWSSLGIFIRKIELPNHCIIFYSSTVAGLLQFILLASTGLFKKVKHADSSLRNTVFLVLAPLCFIANALLFYYAFRNTTIANAVLTHYTAPVFVALLAPLLLKEKIHKTAWLAIILSSIGLWFILGEKNHVSEISRYDREHLGIIAGALSGVAYAFLILTIRRIAGLYSSLFITFIQNGIVTLLLLPFVYTIPLQVQGLKSVKANEAAILGYFEPIGATILALIFFREVPGLQALVGGGLILYSGYMILRSHVK